MNIQQTPQPVQAKPTWDEVRERASSRQPVADISPAAAPHSKPQSTLDALVAGGYLPMLRPCAPPGVPRTFRNRATGALVEKVSDGKVPSSFRAGKWAGMKGWIDLAPSQEHVEEWRQWPNPNWCLVTGKIGVFDIDIKITPVEQGPAADRARRFIAEIKTAIARAVGVAVERLPIRWRDNSTSCAVFVRLTKPVDKDNRPFVNPEGSKHVVEFLAAGQQVVVAGTHTSGANLNCTLLDTPFSALPFLKPEDLDRAFDEISAAAARLGYAIPASKQKVAGDTGAPYSPGDAVLRAVMVRRSEWLPSIVPIVPGDHQEWRVSSAALDRDLEEDLSIYPDGIFDHGTERKHSPTSLICEFGKIDEDGHIEFGGSPIYGPDGVETFAVIAEPDPEVRRPIEREALTWLCRELAGTQFPAFDEGATWKSALSTVARAVGLRWTALVAARWFEYGGGDGPAAWGLEKLVEQADTLSAMEAINPAAFAQLDFWHEVDLRQIVDDRRAAVAAEVPGPETPEPADDDLREPLDIFAQEDPADLSTLPPDCLPPMLRRWVTSEARRKGAPESFAALAAVTVASVAVGSSLRIQPRARDTDFTQPASLWSVIVAEPGRGKSPAISAAEKPLRELDSEWFAAGKDEHARWAAAAQAHRKKPKENPDPGPEPVIPRIRIDDTTLEQQIRVHAQNPRGLLRSPDELMGLFGSLGQYKKGAEADRSQALGMFDGRPMSVDRVGSGSIRAECALMGVLAGTQPQKLAEIARNLGADGMLQRFLAVVDDGKEREAIDEEPDREASALYRHAIRRLATTQFSFPIPLKMSPAGQTAFRSASASIALLRNVSGSTVAWGSHLDKWRMFLPRIVLTFHALEYAFDVEDAEFRTDIGADTVSRAVNFARFLLRHSLRMYQTFFAPDPVATEARAIAGYLLTKPDTETVSPRTISDVRKDLRSDRRKLLAAMAELEGAAWCAVIERGAEGPTRWRVNPKIHVRFEAQAAREKQERVRKRQAIAAAGEARKWINSDKMSEGDSDAG